MPEVSLDQALQLASQRFAAGDLSQAESICRQILTRDPKCVAALEGLGLILYTKRQDESAIAPLLQAIAVAPHSPSAHCNLGVVYQSLGRMEDAIACYRKAISLNPGFALAHANLGLALNVIGQFEQALPPLRQAVALDANDADSLSNLGVALDELGQPDAAIAPFHKALLIAPRHASAQINLGNAFKNQARLDEAIASYRQALTIQPDSADAAQCLLTAIHYHPDYDARSIYQEHARFQQQHEEPLRSRLVPQTNDPRPDRKLRIGYVSGDFCDHPVGHFVLPLLSCHDKSQFDVFCYSATKRQQDQITESIKTHS